MSKSYWRESKGFSLVAKIKNIEPSVCPICNGKYIPTKKWKDKCGLCAEGKTKQTVLMNRTL